MNTIYYLVAFIAGLGIILQTTFNSRLANGLAGDSVTASFFSFAIGAFCLAVYALFRGGFYSSLIAIPSQPLWYLVGGIIGAGALFSYVVLAPKIGFSALLGLAILGQLFSSQIIDHFGLLGAIQRPVSTIKIIGMLIMLPGLAIMLLGDRLYESLFN